MQSLVGENCGFFSEQYVKPREGVKRRRTGLSESFKGRLWLPGGVYRVIREEKQGRG